MKLKARDAFMTNHLQAGRKTADVGPSLLGRMASPFFFHPDTTSEKKKDPLLGDKGRRNLQVVKLGVKIGPLEASTVP